MRKIETLSKQLHELTRWNQNYLFLGMNIMVWIIIASITGIIGCYLYDHTLEGKGLFLVCWLGYLAVSIGFYGGILYLYRKQ